MSSIATQVGPAQFLALSLYLNLINVFLIPLRVQGGRRT